jgi:GntR family transcriptional regulator
MRAIALQSFERGVEIHNKNVEVLPPVDDSAGTLYSSLASELREAVRRGDYSDGKRLPTESELCAFTGVSRQTVRRAYKELVESGLVHRIPGRGTFVSNSEDRYSKHFDSIEDLMSLSKDTQMQIVEPLRRRIDVNAAGRLRTGEDFIYRATFLRIFDETPICLVRISLPMHIGAALSALPELDHGSRSATTFIGLIESKLEISIAEARQNISATVADSALAADLQCDIGDPLLLIDRLYIDSTGTPLELAVSYINPELYSHQTVMRRNGSF